MNQDTETLKIRILAEYYHSRFKTSTAFIFSVTISFFIVLVTLLIQKAIGIEKYFLGIIVVMPWFGLLLFWALRNYHKNLDKIDRLIQQINEGKKLLPPLKQLRKKQFV